MIYNIMRAKKSGDRGYTLLFAVLVSALVLGVGVSILNIARKELLLNAGARESQYAFYAADAGYECAVYWDVMKGSFATSTWTANSTSGSVQCGTLLNATPSGIATAAIHDTNQSGNAYTFTFAIPVAGNACAIVDITKDYKQVVSIGNAYAATTQILSRGYNVGWNNGALDCSKINTSKVERALLINY
ncbi:MAG: hypothetical protein WCQ60_02250 [bacterium]